MKRRHFIVGALAAGLPLPALSQSNDFPSKTIRILIAASPGGGSDLVGRTVATKLSEIDKWSVVAENKPGASGSLALTELSRSAPTGYDLGVGLTEIYSVAPQLMKVPFVPIRDFTPIAIVASTPSVFVVRADSNIQTLKQMVDEAKAKPGSITFGSSGNGSAAHIAGELLQKDAQVKLTHIPYKGSAPAVVDVLGGHIKVACTSIASAQPQLKAGNLRALAVTGAKRDPSLPDTPSAVELGYPNVVINSWFGILGPAKMPVDVVQKLNASINQVTSRQDVKERLATAGLVTSPMSAEEFGSMIRSEYSKMTDIIRSAGISF